MVWSVPVALFSLGLVFLALSVVVARAPPVSCSNGANGAEPACPTLLGEGANPLFFLLGLMLVLGAGVVCLAIRRTQRRRWQRELFTDPAVPTWATR